MFSLFSKTFKSIRYGSIKKRSYVTHAIPTQVVSKRVVNSNPRRLDSIATKIAIQINCKLGGSPWMPSIPKPMVGVMTVGFEVAEDTSRRDKEYGCLVATMDLQKQGSKFFSTAKEVVNGNYYTQLNVSMIEALNAYHKLNEALPEKIIFYRGGVGDGDLSYIRNTEVASLVGALKQRYGEQKLNLIYMVVTKKVNTKFFTKSSDSRRRNVDAGTVVDDVITLDERYKFQKIYNNCSKRY